MTTTSILAIAGSDSCSGAGVQIDIKTAAALGVHATCALTAVTAQNTCGVTGIQHIEPNVIAAQIEASFCDIAPNAIKIGMLGTLEAAQAVREALREALLAHPGVPVVLDPVMVATSGSALASSEAIAFVRQHLLPLATVATPNLPEAAVLAGIAETEPASEQGILQAARLLLEACGETAGNDTHGSTAVLITGGHGSASTCADHLFERDGTSTPKHSVFESERLPGQFHGTGCTLSTAIACGLAQGQTIHDAVAHAHAFVARVLAHPTGLGNGASIIDPLFALGGLTGAQHPQA